MGEASGGEPSPTQSDSRGTTQLEAAPTSPSATPVLGFPVGDLFEPAAWIVEARTGWYETHVRSDRLIRFAKSGPFGDQMLTIEAWDPQGRLVWTYEVPSATRTWAGPDTLRLAVDTVTKGGGLDADRTESELVVLSYADGTVVSRMPLPQPDLKFSRFGALFYYEEPHNYLINSKGDAVRIETGRPPGTEAGIAGGVPFWITRPPGTSTFLTTPSWTLTDYPGVSNEESVDVEVLMIDDLLGLLVLPGVPSKTADPNNVRD